MDAGAASDEAEPVNDRLPSHKRPRKHFQQNEEAVLDSNDKGLSAPASGLKTQEMTLQRTRTSPQPTLAESVEQRAKRAEGGEMAEIPGEHGSNPPCQRAKQSGFPFEKHNE